MTTLYFLSVTLHVLAALFWLGGMFFLGVVGAPVLRKVEPPELRARLFEQLGRQFRGAGWAAVGVLVITGTLNLHFRGWLGPAITGDAMFWGSPYGRALAWKLVAVVVMIAISAAHDFVNGPAAGRVRPGTPEALALRRRASWMARANALVGVALVAVAVRLARGGW